MDENCSKVGEPDIWAAHVGKKSERAAAHPSGPIASVAYDCHV